MSQAWPLVVAVRNLLRYLRASQGLPHLSAGWTDTFILIGRNLGTAYDASYMSNRKLPTVNQRHYFEILFFEKSKQKKIMISHTGWKDRLDPHQPYLIAFIFPSKNRSEKCCKKWKSKAADERCSLPESANFEFRRRSRFCSFAACCKCSARVHTSPPRQPAHILLQNCLAGALLIS